MSPGRLSFIAALLVAAVFAGGLLVGLVRLTGGATYAADAVVIIDQPRAIAAVPSPGVLEKLSRLRLKYAGLLRTRELQDPIADAAGVDVGQVGSGLQVDVAPDSLLLVLRGQTPDPDRSVALAASAADELITYASREQQDAGIPDDQRFAFRVVTPAEQARDVTDVRGRLLPVAASALGLLAAVGAALVARRRA